MSNAPKTEIELDEYTRAEQAAEYVRKKLDAKKHLGVPKIAIVLGSGLGDFANDLQDSVAIPYSEIPHFPQSTAIGHAGKMVIGKLGELTIAAMQGRVHQYEGYNVKQASFPVRVFARLGLRAVILTNAAGGINASYGQGALVLMTDHINLQGANPLTGPNEERFGPRFPDLTEAYDAEFRKFAHEEAKRLDINLHEGVYAALAGPSYETPAEIRYLRTIGADLVGMSTVPEVIVARHMGIRVLAISCVTNMAAGLSGETINHEEVLEIGRRVRGVFLKLLTAVMPRIATTLQ
jgi:purine-nucleoside phosphorylase